MTTQSKIKEILIKINNREPSLEEISRLANIAEVVEIKTSDALFPLMIALENYKNHYNDLSSSLIDNAKLEIARYINNEIDNSKENLRNQISSEISNIIINDIQQSLDESMKNLKKDLANTLQQNIKQIEKSENTLEQNIHNKLQETSSLIEYVIRRHWLNNIFIAVTASLLSFLICYLMITVFKILK